MSTMTSDGQLNWLGFACPFAQPVSRVAVGAGSASSPIGALLSPRGDAPAEEATEVRLWRNERALYLTARCETAAMDRVRELAARRTPYGRDEWGDDALEVQIDVGRTRRHYLHFILPPNGLAITLKGANNRQEHGWYPRLDFQVRLEDGAWGIDAEFPFDMLGRTPADGETWGLNVMRVNPSEPGRCVQWAPTFGDALCPELFGEIVFGDAAVSRQEQIDAYTQFVRERKAFFLATINGIREADALRELGISDWQEWGDYLAQRTCPLPLRWDGIKPGVEGMPEGDRSFSMTMADRLVEDIAGWSIDPPAPVAFAAEPLEALGDAYLLTGRRRYVDAFERAIGIHCALVKQILATVTGPSELHHATNPYHDSQIIRAEMMSYTYLNLRGAGLAPQTHAAMMWTILRSCRFAAFNISAQYTYGNHQLYESAGLAAVAALFPEFPESDEWARIASRSIRLHLEREVYPDGGYMERCGYHSVAMTFTMQAIATIRANGVEDRFAELMRPEVLGILEKMHEWLLWMTAPDGSLPAFGDFGAYSELRFFQRGAAVFGRGDLAWPLSQLAPELVPPGVSPARPAQDSISLDSQFTVMRDGWAPTDFFMAVDHGPLGGQHSHVDTLGFVAYAHGRPVALDSGIGVSYDDPRYTGWFRFLRAHNVIVIDELEADKVAELTRWKPGENVDILDMRSRAYERTLGVVHDRKIVFVKGVGWLIHDKVSAPASCDLSVHRVDWVMHTPYDLKPVAPGILDGAVAGGGLLVLAGRPEELEEPALEQMPASLPPTEARTMRQWDAGRESGNDFTRDITCLSWRRKPVPANACEFVTFLLPYRGARPDAELVQADGGWTLRLAGCVHEMRG